MVKIKPKNIVTSLSLIHLIVCLILPVVVNSSLVFALISVDKANKAANIVLIALTLIEMIYVQSGFSLRRLSNIAVELPGKN